MPASRFGGPNSEVTPAEIALLLDSQDSADERVIHLLISKYAADVRTLVAFILHLRGGNPEGVIRATERTFYLAARDPTSFTGSEKISTWLAKFALEACSEALTNPPSSLSLFGRWRTDLEQRFRGQQTRWTQNSGGEPQLGEPSHLLASLPTIARLPIFLRYSQGFSVQEISEILELAPESILKFLYETRNQLLDNGPPDPPEDVRVPINRYLDNHAMPAGSLPLGQILSEFPHQETYVRKILALEKKLIAELRVSWPRVELSAPQRTRLFRRIQSKLAEIPQKKSFVSPQLREIAWIVVVSLVFILIIQRLRPEEVIARGTPLPMVFPTQTWTAPPAPDSSQLTAQPAWEIARTFVASTSPVNSVAYSPDGRHLAIGSNDHWVRIWGLFDESRFYRLDGGDSPITIVRYSPAGQYIVSGNEDGAIRVWETKDFGQRVALDGNQTSIRNVAFSPDGKLLAVNTARKLWLWEIQDDTFIRFYEISGHEISSASFSPLGGLMAFADGKQVVILSLPAFYELLTYENHADLIEEVTFSPDGRIIASASRDGVLNLVKISSPAEGILDGYLIHTFQHPAGIENLSFLPGGATMAVTTNDRSIYLWSTVTGELLDFIEVGGMEATFSPDGEALVAIGEEGSIHIWRALE